MESYINILIVEDGEVPMFFIRNTAFTKLHKALHDQKLTSIGVSFPNYKVKLGDVIRLHGDKASLESLQQSNWLGGLAGYCEVTDILPVPEKVEAYRTLSRKQPTMRLKKLQKRVEYQKANSILTTDEDIRAYEKQYKEQMFASGFDNPYLELQSASTGEKYRIYIEFGDLQNDEKKGEFNRFGLSKTATIPWF